MRLPVKGCFGVFATIAFFTAIVYVCNHNLEDGKRQASRRRDFSKDAVSEFALRQHGLYGIDLIRCKSIRIEKVKVNGWSLGAFNTLVIKDLEVVLISEEGRATELSGEEGMYEKERTNSRCESAEAMAARLGVSGDFLAARCGVRRFSALSIKNLSVSTLDVSTNVVPRVFASSANADQDGLILKDCGIITAGKTNLVGRAKLLFRPDIKVVWKGGSCRLN